MNKETANKTSLGYVGQIGQNEFLLRIFDNDTGGEAETIRSKLTLTHFEAEALMWLACEKPDRDIAENLKLSPRMVNKHLEHIYTKLGIENHTSATAFAARVLGIR